MKLDTGGFRVLELKVPELKVRYPDIDTDDICTKENVLFRKRIPFETYTKDEIHNYASLLEEDERTEKKKEIDVSSTPEFVLERDVKTTDDDESVKKKSNSNVRMAELLGDPFVGISDHTNQVENLSKIIVEEDGSNDNSNGSMSGLITNYSGTIGSVSLRSDASNISTRSFTFPILQPEWQSSPVKMAKPDQKPQLGKTKGWWNWRHGLLCLCCCRF